MPVDSSIPSDLCFSIDAWCAWAPGLPEAQHWLTWAAQAEIPCGAEKPELAQIPPMLRRRADRLARMAIHTASAVRTAQHCPMIFASQRGETPRAASMLAELAQSAQVAPGPFSLSVHNAVSGLDSIAHGDSSNYIALAAASETAECAIVEACALLADDCESVIVTLYDETLPDCYRPYMREADAAFAWSWRLTQPQGRSDFALSWDSCDEDSTSPAETLPHALSVLRYFLSHDATLTHDGPDRRWTWRRLA